jgi:pimeloyl-ACP methyl ester carboxylesterase
MLYRIVGGTCATGASALAYVRWSSNSSSSHGSGGDTLAALEAAEKTVLTKHVRRATLTHVNVDIGNNEHMSTLIATSSDPNVHRDRGERHSKHTSKTLILYSGWGSGKALWAPVLDELVEHFDRVIAVDPLGFGLSSRPEFTRRRCGRRHRLLFRCSDNNDDNNDNNNDTDNDDDATRARDFFVHSLERWRRGLASHELLADGERFSLLGHSLGGFVAASWALEFGADASGFDRLYLAAPVGVAPWRWQANTPMRRVIAFLAFDAGITPQGLLRSARGYAPELWRSLGERARYRELCSDAWQFLFHSQVAPPSGDVAFMRLLNRDGWALPLLDQLPRIEAPTRIIYGEHDYVSPSFGPTAVEHLTHQASDFVVIRDVGHHMYYQEHAAKQFVNAIVSF